MELFWSRQRASAAAGGRVSSACTCRSPCSPAPRRWRCSRQRRREWRREPPVAGGGGQRRRELEQHVKRHMLQGSRRPQLRERSPGRAPLPSGPAHALTILQSTRSSEVAGTLHGEAVGGSVRGSGGVAASCMRSLSAKQPSPNQWTTDSPPNEVGWVDVLAVDVLQPLLDLALQPAQMRVAGQWRVGGRSSTPLQYPLLPARPPLTRPPRPSPGSRSAPRARCARWAGGTAGSAPAPRPQPCRRPRGPEPPVCAPGAWGTGRNAVQRMGRERVSSARRQAARRCQETRSHRRAPGRQ